MLSRTSLHSYTITKNSNRLFNSFNRIFSQNVVTLLKNNNNNNNINNINSNIRSYGSSTTTTKPVVIGQPTHETHPHLLDKGEVIKGIKLEEFKERRRLLAETLPVGSIALIMTPPEPMMSYDIPYHFRQHTNFYYFTGLNEPEAILVIEKTSDTQYKTSIYLREKIPEREIWDGPRCGFENVTKLFGVDFGYPLTQLDQLKETIGKYKQVLLNKVEWSKVFEKLGNLQYYDLERYLQQMRLVKSQAEIKMMKQSGDIAGDSFKECMKYIRPNMNEQELGAYFEFSIKKRGAQRMSYPPVVAGGNNANTIHYISNNMLLKDGDLCLMDAGAEYWGFTSDITRTYPVNGRFSQAQREIYEAVLDVNKRCIELVKPGASINSIHEQSVLMITEHLQRLGILPSGKTVSSLARSGVYHKYYPHCIGHYLGMDTHDCIDISYGETLTEGMIITIEPGIYIDANDMSVDEKYRGIAIRVEDDVAIVNGKPFVLTSRAPKEISEIESLQK
ncbi:peptidase M24 family protein [Heterostelium album PN500]|uniref:Peptidase M24 family protein n=1 Tax=Heterostelium pallidum (strain ATCC 26659 / Pp 5 / PN500) TaxID=670386 RepID=D3B632_HETP5|nr:peptidase M24 family protein [Heterostelium album PN500]EFA83330.1 peptidase M24 family protein [Heterostelium album PN500]|eukprot:XP_020435447.1 peptidase M24 family protein [Heterostelium album PN500]